MSKKGEDTLSHESPNHPAKTSTTYKDKELRLDRRNS